MKNTNPNEKETQYFLASLSDLLRRHKSSDRVFYTAFLSEKELSDAALFLKNKCFYTVWGGHPDAARAVLAFGNAENSDFPISCLKIVSYGEFSHRDVLGSLMSLGVDRSVFGDIIISEKKTAFVFCLSRFESFVCENLTRIASEGCTVTAVSENEITIPERQFEELRVSVASPRLDCFVAVLAKTSRENAKVLISADKVFLDGICIKNPEKQVSDGSIISVRGFGKFAVDGYDKTSRKGKLQYIIRKFI